MRAVVHVGFHKTGTTTLQYQLFPQLPGVVLLTRTPHHGPPGYVEFAKGLCKFDADRFDAAGLRAYLERVAPEEPGTLLLSDEGISGIPYLGTHLRAESTGRVATLLPEARVLIGIRSQATMWRSLYSDYVNTGGYRSFAAFAADADPGYRFELDYLRYDRFIEAYHERFGPDRVKVVAYEQLGSDPVAYMREVAAFVLEGSGLDVPALEPLAVTNASLSRWSRGLVRLRNRLFRTQPRYNPRPLLFDFPMRDLDRALRRFDPVVFSRSRSLSGHDARALASLLPYYEEVNARVVELTGLDLARYGYPLPPSAQREARIGAQSNADAAPTSGGT